MLEGVWKYFANTGLNVMDFSKAIVQSASSLVPDRAAVIATSLFQISATDFLPAALAFAANDYLQENFTQYAEEQPDEASAYRNGVILVASSINLLFYSYIISHTLRGSARTLALTATIPHLFHEDNTDLVPPIEGPDGEIIRFMRKYIEINNPKHDIYLKNLRNGLFMMGERVIDATIERAIPEYFITKSFFKLLIGYEIINYAVNRNDLKRLSQKNIKSLPLLVGAAYCLGTYIKDLALFGSTNSYLNLLIDNCLYISLFTLMANLKLRNLDLHSESFSLDGLQDAYSAYKKGILSAANTEIRKLITSELMINLPAMDGTGVSLTIAKMTVLPTLLHSPKDFFEDKAIGKLVESLPKEVKIYLLEKYSQKEIEAFLGYLEIKITRQRPARYVGAVCSFFATKKWSDEFRDALLSAKQRDELRSLGTGNNPGLETDYNELNEWLYPK